MANVELQGVEVEFRDLTKEAQERLYLSNKEKFQNEAAKSKYISIKLMVAKDESSSSECLNVMLRKKITNKNKQVDDVVLAILANPKFTMEEKTRKLCAESDYWKYRKIAAEDEGSSSEFLNAMLREEINNKRENLDVVKAILSNKNLLLQDDLRNACAKFYHWEVRLMIAEDAETPKELLEAMREREYDASVKNAINTNLSNKEKNKQMLEMLKGFIPSENQAVECFEKIKAIMY